MKKLTILRFWLSVIVLLIWATLSLAQNQPETNKPSVKLTLVQEADGVFVTSTDTVSDVTLEVFLISGQRVYASETSRGERVKFLLQNAAEKPLADGQYLYIATHKFSPSELLKYFGRLTLHQAGKAEMEDAGEVINAYEQHDIAQRQLPFEPDAKQEEIDKAFLLFQANAKVSLWFFNLAVKLIPDSDEALLGQGFAIAATAGLSGFQMEDIMDPPTPPPPPPPGRKWPQAREQKINREGLLRAIDAFKQSILVSDCKGRAEGGLFVSAIYSKLNDLDQARDWRLKSVEMDCATAITRATAYYSIAVENWQCANAITERYTLDKRALRDPWYPRQITAPADQEKFNTCMARSSEYLKKTLFDAPDHYRAVGYQSLLYREKQKTAKLKAEQLKYAALAEKATQRAMELFERESKKQ